MKKIILLFSVSCTLLTSLLTLESKPSFAQTCNYFAGTAVGGQRINVDLCSIAPASPESVDFVYFLGNEKVVSQANCVQGHWVSFPERQINRPQSEATQRMLEIVCSYRNEDINIPRGRQAVVFDPPSNVRVVPNGEILCSVNNRRRINTYGSAGGSWYYTDVCGTMGVIHSSQIATPDER